MAVTLDRREMEFLYDNGDGGGTFMDMEDYDQVELNQDLLDDALLYMAPNSTCTVLFHEGKQDHIHISIVAKRAILLVIFDDRSSLGLVRLRVKRASNEMESIFDQMSTKTTERPEVPAATSPFSEITDEDIDALFSE